MNSEKTVDTKRAVYEDEDGTVVQREQRSVSSDQTVPARNVLQQITYIIMIAINGLIAIRFVLSLFGANRSNTFADIIYSVTTPFVAPFRSLFSVDTQVGETGGRFEIESIVAIIVYSLIAWMIIRVVAIGSRENDSI